MTDLNKIEQDIKKLTSEIEEAKTNLSENKGQLKVLMSQLKDTYGFNTVEEANTELREMIKEIEKLGNDIRGDYEALNEEMLAHD